MANNAMSVMHMHTKREQQRSTQTMTHTNIHVNLLANITAHVIPVNPNIGAHFGQTTLILLPPSSIAKFT